MRPATLVSLLALVGACDPPTDDDGDPTPTPSATDLANPLVPEVGLFPWPSDQYLAIGDDGVSRIEVPVDLLPQGVTPERMAESDGFSRIVPILTWFDGGVDPASLPDPTDWGATLDDESPVALVRVDTGERVPLLVELDAATENPAQQTLLLRPHHVLAPATTYAVLLTDDLRGPDGSPVPRSDALDAILGDTEPSGRAQRFWWGQRETLRGAADAAGYAPEALVQAWTFTTRSEADATAEALALQDLAGETPLSELTLTLDDPIYEDDRALVYGTLELPWYLDGDNRLVTDDDGAPVQQGTEAVPVLLTVPRSVTSTREGVLFGHGFFSSYREPTWSNLFQSLERWERPALTTRFYGFYDEEDDHGALLAAAQIIAGDLSSLDTIIDQQLQTHHNFTLLHRIGLDQIAEDVTLDWGDGAFQPLADTSLPYMGISNGGTQGLVMMTTSPVLDRGALIVPGGGWSHMLQRAAQWATLGAPLADRYGDPRVLQLTMSLLQQVFDPVDSLNYVEHLVDDRLPGRPADPDLLLVEAVNDSQVANLVTRWCAGAAGAPLITPSVADVWGVPTVDADDLDGVRVAYEIYDLGVEDNPTGNVPPEENGVHNDVRLLESYKEQVGAFLATGEIVRACDGACDPD